MVKGLYLPRYPDDILRRRRERDRAEFSKSLWKPTTWGSSTSSRLNAQIEKRLLSGKRESIVERQAQASPLYNRAGLLGSSQVSLQVWWSVCTCKPATLWIPCTSVWNRLLPASPAFFPSSSPGALGYRLSFHLSALSLGVSSCRKPSQTLALTLSSSSTYCNLHMPSFRGAVWETAGTGPQAQCGGCLLFTYPLWACFSIWKVVVTILDPLIFQDFLNLFFEKVLHMHAVHSLNKRIQWKVPLLPYSFLQTPSCLLWRQSLSPVSLSSLHTYSMCIRENTWFIIIYVAFWGWMSNQPLRKSQINPKYCFLRSDGYKASISQNTKKGCKCVPGLRRLIDYIKALYSC